MKNKVAPPFRQAEFDPMYGEGISRQGCIVDMAVDCGVAKKSGAWYTYGDERLGQGREAAKQTLRENPDIEGGNRGERRAASTTPPSRGPHPKRPLLPRKKQPRRRSRTHPEGGLRRMVP